MMKVVSKTTLDRLRQMLVEKLKEDLGKEDWDVFLTLNFRKYIPFSTGFDKIYVFDGLMARRMVGRRYNKDKNQPRRMSFFGTGGLNGLNQLHYHLLVKLPDTWSSDNGSIRRFREMVELYFPQVGGKEVDFRLISPESKENRINYLFKDRHCPLDSSGLLDTERVVVSKNLGWKL